MPASPRLRARCNLHEARAGLVALISCCLVRLSSGGLGPPCVIVSLPACTQRSICRGAALETWACGQATSESIAQDLISARVSVPLLDWLPARVAHDFCNLEGPDALGDDSSFFAVTQQEWRACVRSMLSCKLCVHIATLLSCSQISSFRSIRGCEGRRTMIVTEHRAYALALLPTLPTHDLWKIRDGTNCNSRHQTTFLPVRGSSFPRGDTGDRSSPHTKLARTLGR